MHRVLSRCAVLDSSTRVFDGICLASNDGLCHGEIAVQTFNVVDTSRVETGIDARIRILCATEMDTWRVRTAALMVAQAPTSK